jgi:hypothetical protein
VLLPSRSVPSFSMAQIGVILFSTWRCTWMDNCCGATL